MKEVIILILLILLIVGATTYVIIHVQSIPESEAYELPKNGAKVSLTVIPNVSTGGGG